MVEALLLSAAGPRSGLGLPFIEGIAGAIAKSAIPILGYLALAPLLWLFFRDTWKQLDAESVDYRMQMRLADKYDYRPWALFALTALILTAQEYYGGSRFFHSYIRPWLREVELAQRSNPGGWGQYVDTRFYGSLYGYAWWSFTRVAGYLVLPMVSWKILFRKDSILDFGLRTKGLLTHSWIYILCLVVIVPTVVIVAQSPEFATYYPFYKQSSRSWFDLLMWEAMYLAQFFALEVFFRGFMLVPLRRTMGSGAIFAMCVPYVMIHYGKPYLESSGAFLAGVVLGSLSMRTRSIYLGFLLHCTVAVLMDALALSSGKGFPTMFWPR